MPETKFVDEESDVEEKKVLSREIIAFWAAVSDHMDKLVGVFFPFFNGG